MREDRVDVCAVHPAGLRRCRRESNEVDQVDGGTPTVEQAYQVEERVPPVVAARRGERPAPVVHLRVQVRKVRRKRERAQMPEPRKPHREVSAPVVEGGDKGVLHLIEVALGVMSQRVPLAGRQRP